MKVISAIIFFLFSTALSYAEEYPDNLPEDHSTELRVGVLSFFPPFSIQGQNNHYTGFDIGTAQYVCKHLHKTCHFITLNRNTIYPAIMNHDVDMTLAGLTVMPIMKERVLYSIPYMISEGRFIGDPLPEGTTFNIEVIKNRTIGARKNSAYALSLEEMGVNPDHIKTFDSELDIISAIHNGSIDLGFINSKTAEYWMHNTPVTIQLIGDPVPVGNGLTIAVNLNDKVLLKEINEAIYSYQDSNDFKLNYDLYLSGLEPHNANSTSPATTSETVPSQ